MRVTGLEQGCRRQIRVFVEEEFAFSLFDNEVARFGIKEDLHISPFLFDEIEAAVFLRGKRKALDCLKRKDYTESELKHKLIWYGFSCPMTERILNYIHSYHYLDDERYARSYILSKKNTKSVRQISLELSQKGIDKDKIDALLENETHTDEDAIQLAISKKTKDLMAMDFKERQKLAASLFRKGFLEADIRRHLKI